MALAFAHFSRKLLLKEQMIIPVRKTLNNAGHIDAELIDFSEICQKKNQQNQLFFTDCFLAKFPPWNFPWNRPIFLRICPWKSFEIWLFSAKIPRSRTIFRRILTFFPWNRPIFPRICPWKSREILLFFREISEALVRWTKRIIFCHSGKLKPAFTSPNIISTSSRCFLTSRIDFTVLLLFELLKKHHLPVGQVENRIH